jgi:hypothetical protein
LVGAGLVALGIWARGRAAGRSYWGVPVVLGLASLSVSAAQRFRPEWERAVLVAAFVVIGATILYVGLELFRPRGRRE